MNAAIVVLAGTESHADLGRVTNALEAAREFAEEGDDLVVIFDGAGTQWVPELEDESHPLNATYRSLTEYVQVCEFCAGAFEVGEAIESSAVETTATFEGHPSIRTLVAEGYEVITF